MFLKSSLFFIIFYILIKLLQFFAGVEGIIHLLGLHWIFSGFAALILLFIPVIGPFVGVYGAVQGWGWSPIWAILLFFGYYFIYFFLFLSGAKVSFDIWKKIFSPSDTFRHGQQDIEPDFTVKQTNEPPSQKTLLIQDKRNQD